MTDHPIEVGHFIMFRRGYAWSRYEVVQIDRVSENCVYPAGSKGHTGRILRNLVSAHASQREPLDELAAALNLLWDSYHAEKEKLGARLRANREVILENFKERQAINGI